MQKVGNICKLSELEVGQVGKVLKLEIENKIIKRHLLDMGITQDTIVSIKKIAPMGDPIDLSLRDYELCICKSDLENIKVKVIK